MPESIVGFSGSEPLNRPSGSIWGDCPQSLLNELGTGVYRHVDFLGGPTGTLATDLDVDMVAWGDALAMDADTDTVLGNSTTERGGWLDIETDADDNDAAAIFSDVFCEIVRGSGKKVWFEAYLQLGDVDADQGVFVGLAEAAALNRDILANDVGAAGVAEESLVGFVIDNGDDDAVDAIYRLDNGTVAEVAADVTNSTRLPAGERASLVDDTPRKLGLRYDGYRTMTWFVDGYAVATQDVDSTFPTGVNLGAIIGIKTGAAAAESAAIGWVRYAFEDE